jgi:hypothetical protein
LPHENDQVAALFGRHAFEINVHTIAAGLSDTGE